MHVNWTESALESLDRIFEYISREAPVYAQHFIQQLMATVDRLEQQPLSGRAVPEIERDNIREVIFHRYRIIYWVISSDKIDIISVVHSSRDLSQISSPPWETH